MITEEILTKVFLTKGQKRHMQNNPCHNSLLSVFSPSEQRYWLLLFTVISQFSRIYDKAVALNDTKYDHS